MQRARDALADAAHELKSPLALIRLCAEKTLKTDLKNAAADDDIVRSLKFIISEADRLTALVRRTLEATDRGGSAAGRYVRGDFCLSALFGRLAEAFAARAEQAGVTLSFECGGGVSLYEDEARVEQALHNLIANAVAHTPAGGRVLVAAQPCEKRRLVAVTVSDEGRGITPSDIRKVWRRRFAAGSAAGNGLGLAITRGIFRAGRMRFSVRSTPGEGAAFTFLARQSPLSTSYVSSAFTAGASSTAPCMSKREP